MKYEFKLDDYYQALESISKKTDAGEYGFKKVKVTENEDGELYAYGCRVVIPELGISVREGVEYYAGEDDEEEEYEEDSIIIYPENEKDPHNFIESCSNALLTSLVSQIGYEKTGNPNPTCYIDDEEFILGL